MRQRPDDRGGAGRPALAGAVASSAVALAVTDLRGQVLDANDAFAHLLHLPPDHLPGAKVADLLTAGTGHEDVLDLDRVVEELLGGTPLVVTDLLARRPDGSALRGQVLCSLARDPARGGPDHGEGTAPVLLLQVLDGDATGRRRPGEHDALTRLRSRHAVVADLTARLRAPSGLVGVIACDLDRFRVVNESLGHAAGDELLVGVARRLLAGVRGGDVVARLGDDEFVVVLTGLTDVAEAVDVAHRLTRHLGAPFEVDGPQRRREIRCAVSTGLVVVDLDAVGHPCPATGAVVPPPDAASVLREANTALDAAKAAGGGCCRVFTGAMRERAIHRLTVENDLRRALERDELRVHYQPVVDLRDGRRSGFEALVRWAHPQRGLLLPGQFLDVAEECGLLSAVDAVVLERALDFLARHPGVRVAVNTSARRLDGTFAADLAGGLRRRELPPGRLAVELLETSLASGDPVVERELLDLADLGVEVLLDDFGTGYSALSYLRRLPVTGLKLDGSFVADLPGDDSSDRIAAAVVNLAGSFGLSSICEGVETAAQAEHLAAQGWQSAQGFHFGAPAPEERWFPRSPSATARPSAQDPAGEPVPRVPA